MNVLIFPRTCKKELDADVTESLLMSRVTAGFIVGGGEGGIIQGKGASAKSALTLMNRRRCAAAAATEGIQNNLNSLVAFYFN